MRRFIARAVVLTFSGASMVVAAGAGSDPVAEEAFRQYKGWRKVNTAPVLSASHGNRYLFTYLNKTAEPSGLHVG